MWPRPAARIGPSAATVPFISPVALTSSIAWRVPALCSHGGPLKKTPALLTQRSSEPVRPRESARARQAASSRTSSAVPLASLPSSAATRSAAPASTSVTWTR
jgi:hypothetical protein